VKNWQSSLCAIFILSGEYQVIGRRVSYEVASSSTNPIGVLSCSIRTRRYIDCTLLLPYDVYNYIIVPFLQLDLSSIASIVWRTLNHPHRYIIPTSTTPESQRAGAPLAHAPVPRSRARITRRDQLVACYILGAQLPCVTDATIHLQQPAWLSGRCLLASRHAGCSHLCSAPDDEAVA